MVDQSDNVREGNREETNKERMNGKMKQVRPYTGSRLILKQLKANEVKKSVWFIDFIVL